LHIFPGKANNARIGQELTLAMAFKLVNTASRSRYPGQPGRIKKKVSIQIFSRVCILLLLLTHFEIPELKIPSEIEGSISYKSIPCPEIIMDATKESSHAIPHAKEMRNASLCRSLAHQHKFFSVRDSVLSWVKSHKEERYLLRGTGKGGRLFAFKLNKDYAFRHIFKSGGTTIQEQTRAGHVPQWSVGNRSLMTLVRDPIDHFLSGWAECGYRCFDEMMNLTTSDAYDDRVTAWLQYVQSPKSKPCLKRVMLHSMPQANYLWEGDSKFEWDGKLDLVGDLDELPGLLELIDVHYNESLKKGNVAKGNEIKNRYFPRNKNILSNSTLKSICSYVALDYYLFSFEPPLACRKELLMANVADTNIIVQ